MPVVWIVVYDANMDQYRYEKIHASEKNPSQTPVFLNEEAAKTVAERFNAQKKPK